MRRPLDGDARRPKTIRLKANTRCQELYPVLEQIGIGVRVEKKLPKIDKLFPELRQELRKISRAKMIRPDTDQATVETMFPTIAQYVQGCGFIEIGDQQGFGFVVRAMGYGGVDFEDNRPESLAEAMVVLEAGLSRWYKDQGIEIE